MRLADVGQHVLDKLADVGARRMDPSDELSERPGSANRRRRVRIGRAHLRNDLEPGVDADASEALHNGGGDFLSVTVLEPEREETKRVLQRVARRQGDRAEEGCEVGGSASPKAAAAPRRLTLHGGHEVVREDGSRDRVLLVLRPSKVRDDLRVGKRPGVPGLVPHGVEVGGEKVRL